MKFFLALAVVAVSALSVDPLDPMAAECVERGDGSCYLKNSG